MADLKAGTKDPTYSYADSMAQAMEEAFKREWPFIMGDEAPVPPVDDQLRLMFIAVAQGVIRHLRDNPRALIVSGAIDDVNDTFSGNVTTVNTTGQLY